MRAPRFLCALALCALLQPCTSVIFGDFSFKWPWESSSEEDTDTGSSGGPSGGSPSSGGSGSGVTEAERNEIVAKHNNFRRGVQPPASNMLKMQWNTEAAANAQAWVNKCTGGHSEQDDRKISTSDCGENWAGYQARISWSTVIQDWYNEVNDWRYNIGSINGNDVGHFTQVVWYNSIKVGCGMAYCPNHKYKYQYICQYCPPGNYKNLQPYKSGRTCGDCPGACDNGLCTNPCPYINQYTNCDSLKKQNSCSDNRVYNWCPASCKCMNKII